MKQKDNKTLILLDDSNIFYGFQKVQWDIDYQRFFDWLKREFNPIDIYNFAGIISKRAFFNSHPTHTITGFRQCKERKENFFKKLRQIGYKVRTKPVASLYDNTSGEYKRKCNFDVEMTIIALDRIDDYQEFVLCSGDGDFVKLLKYLKGKHKKTTIISHKDRSNWELEKAANRVVYFHQLKEEVQKVKGLP